MVVVVEVHLKQDCVRFPPLVEVGLARNTEVELDAQESPGLHADGGSYVETFRIGYNQHLYRQGGRLNILGYVFVIWPTLNRDWGALCGFIGVSI